MIELEQFETFVIAECGSSHEGNFDDALALIKAAAETGADAAKFQYWSDGDRLADRRHAPELATVYSDHEMPRGWLPDLRRACDERGIVFACSTFLPEDVWAVAEHCNLLKISSFECNDRELLTMHRAAIAVGKNVAVSFGMGASTRLADELLSSSDHRCYWRLHCVSAYPVSDGRLWLSRIGGRAEYRDLPMHGFSDHSPSNASVTGALAVAAGARVVERHLRLETTPQPNPDFAHSMTPDGFGSYVLAIRAAERALGGPPAGDEGMASENESLRYRVVNR